MTQPELQPTTAAAKMDAQSAKLQLGAIPSNRSMGLRRIGIWRASGQAGRKVTEVNLQPEFTA